MTMREVFLRWCEFGEGGGPSSLNEKYGMTLVSRVPKPSWAYPSCYWLDRSPDLVPHHFGNVDPASHLVVPGMLQGPNKFNSLHPGTNSVLYL